MNYKSIEERLTVLEKEVAELKEQVSTQPEKVVESVASGLKATFAKMVGQKQACGIPTFNQPSEQEIKLDKERVYAQECADWKRNLSYAIRRNLPKMTVAQMKTLIRQLDEGIVKIAFISNDNR